MAREHTHWDGGPVCRFPTKRECDAFVRAHYAKLKADFEAASATKAAEERERRNRAIDKFIEKEWERMLLDQH